MSAGMVDRRRRSWKLRAFGWLVAFWLCFGLAGHLTHAFEGRVFAGTVILCFVTIAWVAYKDWYEQRQALKLAMAADPRHPAWRETWLSRRRLHKALSPPRFCRRRHLRRFMDGWRAASDEINSGQDGKKGSEAESVFTRSKRRPDVSSATASVHPLSSQNTPGDEVTEEGASETEEGASETPNGAKPRPPRCPVTGLSATSARRHRGCQCDVCRAWHNTYRKPTKQGDLSQ